MARLSSIPLGSDHHVRISLIDRPGHTYTAGFKGIRDTMIMIIRMTDFPLFRLTNPLGIVVSSREATGIGKDNMFKVGMIVKRHYEVTTRRSGNTLRESMTKRRNTLLTHSGIALMVDREVRLMILEVKICVDVRQEKSKKMIPTFIM